MQCNSFLKIVIIYFSILISLSIGYLITLPIYCSSAYVHEGGHIIFGFTDNLFHGNSFDFNISAKDKCLPPFSFLKFPQQTEILKGRVSPAFAFGGSLIILFLSIYTALIIYKKFRYKLAWTIPLIFLWHEIFGNFLCGTDNLSGKAYQVCTDYNLQNAPMLAILALIGLIAYWIYPKIAIAVKKFIYSKSIKQFNMSNVILTIVTLIITVLFAGSAVFLWIATDRDAKADKELLTNLLEFEKTDYILGKDLVISQIINYNSISNNNKILLGCIPYLVNKDSPYREVNGELLNGCLSSFKELNNQSERQAQAINLSAKLSEIYNNFKPLEELNKSLEDYQSFAKQSEDYKGLGMVLFIFGVLLTIFSILIYILFGKA